MVSICVLFNNPFQSQWAKMYIYKKITEFFLRPEVNNLTHTVSVDVFVYSSLKPDLFWSNSNFI